MTIRKLGNNAERVVSMPRLLRRIKIRGAFVVGLFLPQKIQMKLLTTLLCKNGMRIKSPPIYVSRSVFFDGTDYSLIHLGANCVISSHVSILTHDFSVSRVFRAHFGRESVPEISQVRGVTIGDNCFVGRSALLLPGTEIGDNSIIGAGSVVRGKIPADSLVIGNPGLVVGKASDVGMKILGELGILVDKSGN